jgi:HD-like signal output (HDOD) protein
MREWWERTQRVAAISGVLARMSERFDPDFASLVGLLHSIAEPVMLGYADRHPDLVDSVRLDNLLYANRAHLGRILLVLWGLQREIVEAATHCNHWQREHPGDADYTDILLVAQWHALIGTPRQRHLPAIEDIPAFRRLGLHDASPEMSLRIIEAGRGAVDQAEAALRR